MHVWGSKINVYIYAVETFGGQLKLLQLESELYVLSVLPFSADRKAYNDIMA